MKNMLAILTSLLMLAACEQMKQPKEAPINSLKLTEQGYTLLSQQEPKAALDVFNKAIKADEKNGRAYQGKGIALDSLGEHGKAEEAYNEGLKQTPGNVGLSNNLAMSHILRGNYQKAIDLLAPFADFGNPTVHENLALANCMLGKSTEARKLYSKTLSPAEIEDNIRFCRKFEQIRKS
jgi:Flp pilus assembly protein TadD